MRILAPLPFFLVLYRQEYEGTLMDLLNIFGVAESGVSELFSPIDPGPQETVQG